MLKYIYKYVLRKGNTAMYENINTQRIDAMITPEKMRAFINASFPDLDRVQAKEAWNAYRDFFKFERLKPCRDVFYYVMERDGWSRHRFQNTNYFLRPGYTVKRGRPADGETVTQLKARIKQLETENRILKQTITEMQRSR
jgi:hypothetical protein